MRTCFACKIEQPEAEFYIEAEQRRAATLGRSTFWYPCRTCNSARAKRAREPKRAVVNAAKAGGCVDCGLVNLEHPEIFGLDHLDHESKSASVSSLITKGSLDDLHAEIAKCEVVCANCHRIRTASRPAVTRGRSRF